MTYICLGHAEVKRGHCPGPDTMAHWPVDLPEASGTAVGVLRVHRTQNTVNNRGLSSTTAE